MEWFGTLKTLELESYNTFLIYWFIACVLNAIYLHKSKELPLSNRIESQGMGVLGSIDKKTGWVLMEIPVLLVVGYFFLQNQTGLDVSSLMSVSGIMVAFFVVHYFNRAVIYPQRIKVAGKTMPVYTMLTSMVFYIVNGYLIGHYFGQLREYPIEWLYDPRFLIGVAVIYPQRIKVAGKTMPVYTMLTSMVFYIVNGYLIGHYFGQLREYPIEWLYDPRFLIGVALFLFGFFVNIHSDNILINLRDEDEAGYKIPHGGFFKHVSCPNYMGECIEWIGFAIMTWSSIGFVYAAWVVLPLFIQARVTHQWYVDQFGDSYPKDRKAIIPSWV